ncbi:MAG TPA: DEAD/DEAH box helicase [Gammaproteobacteria bacterium]|nr:DEAD/DEAH box helicase [Gammaproteobacteria bacterium]
MSFDSLGLSAALLRAVAEQGYTEPTPIQRGVIPVVLAGRDVMAGAQTGTGKTAGFALPMLERLMAAGTPGGHRRVRALILTPTRELAAQVAESVRVYGKHVPLKSAVIFGGVSINPQIAELRRGVDIVIATPGRLLDHVQQRHVDLSHVEIFVLDEADRMLDMGFLPDIRRVIATLPRQRQSLLFSATFPDDIRQLANKLLRDPASIEVGQRNATADRISQCVYFVDKGMKRDALSWLIGSGDWRQVLVFTRTKHGANRLAEQLEQDGISTAAIHGNKSQGARTRALADFKRNAVRVLVATDIAARGLDINELPHVVNYDLPEVPEHYVHRIGRTGRAGKEGLAISLVAGDERSLLKEIERLLRQQLPVRNLDGYTPRAREQRPERREQTQAPRRRDGHRQGGRHGHGAQPQRHRGHGNSHGERHKPHGARAQGPGRGGNR